MNMILNQRDDIKAFTDICIRLVYHAILISISAYLFSIGEYTLSILIAIPHWITYSFLGSAGLSHELFHNSVFSNTKINNILHIFFMILNWENSNYFKQTHWIHHKITLDEKDPKTIFRKKIRLLYLVQLLTFDVNGFINKFSYTLKNAFGILPVGKSYYIFEKDKDKMKSVTNMAQIILLFHLLTSMIFICVNQWWFIFLINLAPFTISFFNRILGFAQHYGLSANHPTDYYNNCRTIILSKFWSFFYSNMNYHIEHHMYPYIPYYRLKEIHQELRADENYKNLSIGWFSLINDLRKKGMFELV